MSGPSIQRDGDTWSMAWSAEGVAMGMEKLVERREELRALVTVESTAAGRVVGPVNLNLLSSESQTRFANACADRVNGLSKDRWRAIVVAACSIVVKQFMTPTPVLDLSEVDTSTGVEYLIPGLIPTDETTVLYGDGESAKSLLALRIAASVMTGQQLPWLDRPTRVCRALYLDWETNPRTVAGRLKRIARGMETIAPKMLYRQCFRTLGDELPSVREEISKQQIELVIIDSIGFAAGGALVEDETARANMNYLRQMSPATRLVVAHISADAARQTTGAARPFGSAFFWNGMRSGLELRRAEESANADEVDLGLYHRKANDGEHHKPIGINVMFDGRTGPIAMWPADVNETADLAARTPLSSRLRALLRKGAAETDDLAEQVDAPIDTVSKTLKRMTGVQQLSEGGGRGHSAKWGLAADAE